MTRKFESEELENVSGGDSLVKVTGGKEVPIYVGGDPSGPVPAPAPAQPGSRPVKIKK